MDLTAHGDSPEDADRQAGAMRDGEIRVALKETILNIERLVEDAERVLRRARERLAALFPEESGY
jgi:hypothetical protein